MNYLDLAADMARAMARGVHRRAQDESGWVSVPSDTPESPLPLGPPQPAEHEPGCSCCDCLEADAWAEDAERTRTDELNESQHP